jgi:hypothetical protein
MSGLQLLKLPQQLKQAFGTCSSVSHSSFFFKAFFFFVLETDATEAGFGAVLMKL